MSETFLGMNWFKLECSPQVAAQVGHAAVGLYQALQEKNSWREMAWKWDHSG